MVESFLNSEFAKEILEEEIATFVVADYRVSSKHDPFWKLTGIFIKCYVESYFDAKDEARSNDCITA